MIYNRDSKEMERDNGMKCFHTFLHRVPRSLHRKKMDILLRKQEDRIRPACDHTLHRRGGIKNKEEPNMKTTTKRITALLLVLLMTSSLLTSCSKGQEEADGAADTYLSRCQVRTK